MTSKLTRERLQEIAEDGFLKHGEGKELARMVLAAMDQKPALHRYRRKAVEPYGPYPWHYEEFVDLSRPLEGIEDEYYYAAPPAVSGFAVDSEPVAYADPRAFENFESGSARREWMWRNPGEDLVPLYRHAHPAPVVPEEMTIRDACKFVQDMRLFDDVSVIVMRTWNACRAAMLAAAPQETNS